MTSLMQAIARPSYPSYRQASVLTSPLLRNPSFLRLSRTMSSKNQQPEILGTEELKTEAKWLKMERIRWKDQEGKEVGRR